jgi:hypothetical protein
MRFTSHHDENPHLVVDDPEATRDPYRYASWPGAACRGSPNLGGIGGERLRSVHAPHMGVHAQIVQRGLSLL